jgi:hypothetical protein
LVAITMHRSAAATCMLQSMTIAFQSPGAGRGHHPLDPRPARPTGHSRCRACRSLRRHHQAPERAGQAQRRALSGRFHVPAHPGRDRGSEPVANCDRFPEASRPQISAVRHRSCSSRSSASSNCHAPSSVSSCRCSILSSPRTAAKGTAPCPSQNARRRSSRSATRS